MELRTKIEIASGITAVIGIGAAYLIGNVKGRFNGIRLMIAKGMLKPEHMKVVCNGIIDKEILKHVDLYSGAQMIEILNTLKAKGVDIEKEYKELIEQMEQAAEQMEAEK